MVSHLGLMELKSDDQEPLELNIAPCYPYSSTRAIRQAYRYGRIANSRQHFTDLPESFSQRYVVCRTLYNTFKTDSTKATKYYLSSVNTLLNAPSAFQVPLLFVPEDSVIIWTHLLCI